jgi:hypothetical protein
MIKKVKYISQSTAYDKKGNRISYATYGIRNYLDVQKITYDDKKQKLTVTFLKGETPLLPHLFSIETKETYHKDVRKESLSQDKKKLQHTIDFFDKTYYKPLREKLATAHTKIANTPLEESIFASQKEYDFIKKSFQINKNEIEMMSIQLEQIRARYVH